MAGRGRLEAARHRREIRGAMRCAERQPGEVEHQGVQMIALARRIEAHHRATQQLAERGAGIVERDVPHCGRRHGVEPAGEDGEPLPLLRQGRQLACQVAGAEPEDGRDVERRGALDAQQLEALAGLAERRDILGDRPVGVQGEEGRGDAERKRQLSAALRQQVELGIGGGGAEKIARNSARASATGIDVELQARHAGQGQRVARGDQDPRRRRAPALSSGSICAASLTSSSSSNTCRSSSTLR